MLKINRENNESGQALVTLLFFVLIATIYISAAVIILIVNSLSATNTMLGFSTSRLAEGAFEDTLLRLLRDPNYAGGTFNLDGGNATVSVSAGNPRDVDVAVVSGNYFRRFEGQVQFNQTEMTILSWKETF